MKAATMSVIDRRKFQLNMLLHVSLLMLIFFALLLNPKSVEARFKCWTNSEGVKECGESVPPEYSQQGHQEVSKSGIVMDKKDAAKSDDEIAEQKRLANEERAEKREKEEQRRKDRILMETFSSVDDIHMTRDGKLTAIESSIKLTKKRSENIQLDLDKRIKQAATAERQGKTPSEDLLKDIESLKKQIEDNDLYIAEKLNEQEELNAEYAAYEERYKELKQSD